MKKISNLFKKLSLPFALLGVLTMGGIFSLNSSIKNQPNAYADFSTLSHITNELPSYMIINSSSEASNGVSKVDESVYLFQNGSYNDIKIANQILTRNEVEVNNEKYTETNYYYQPSSNNDQIYYYFDFTSSLSLYYDMTTADLKSGKKGENILISQNITNYTAGHEHSFRPEGTSLTPKKFNLRFELNTLLNEVSFGEEDKHLVTLNKEGIYTLVIPVVEYYTNNGGITFTSSTRDIYYNFMIFNANTYFDTITGKPRITVSSNVQETNLASTSAFSTYYFYNFAYSGEERTLPQISFNPQKFSITVKYTDIELNTHFAKIEYQNGELIVLGQNGNELTNEEKFINVYSSSETGNANIVFYDIGSYDIYFSYLYTITRGNITTQYDLRLDELGNNSVFKNKAQRVYIYGYQTVYSDYSDINTITNQPNTKDLKTYDKNNGYSYNADITSQVNSHILKNHPDFPGIIEKNPSSASEFNKVDLKSYALEAINSNKEIQPASTNQTPIKFLSNVKNTNFSYFYNLTTGEDGQITADDEISFQGFNQNKAGTYLYIIQYQFDSFMSTSGTLQSAKYHYQIFYFTVTNYFPTVGVLDSNYNEIYTNGFTNKNVYILNDAENNIYDAKVEITLSAYNYNTKAYYFQDINIKNLSSYGFNYQAFSKATNEADDSPYNTNIAGKYGFLIENTSRYANAKFTIKVTSANSTKPSSRTFTIDTSEIKNITSRSVRLLSSTTYQIEDAFSQFNTNQPMVFSWDEKASGATTYGYVSYISTQEINYYSSLEGSELRELINRLLSSTNNVLPVSYKIDMSLSSNWTQYYNSLTFGSTIPSTYVKSNDGFYILEVYDQAGNSAFEVYLIDTSAPIFIQEVIGDQTTRSIFTNSDCISVPETDVDINIRWSKKKAIYLENLTEILNLTSYPYGSDVISANEKLHAKLNDFFSAEENNNIFKINDITVNAKENAGIPTYNNYYLAIPINERVYIKEGDSSTFNPFDLDTYHIKFFNEAGEMIADNTTFKILLRDSSNTHFADNESLAYRNYPSGYVSFNVTADAAKMMILNEEGSIDFSSFNYSGNLYKYTAKDETEESYFTHIASEEEGFEPTELQFKFSYYSPANAKDKLRLSYIPVAENGSELESILLTYYPYERKVTQFENNPNFYYYYDITSDESKIQKINVFSATGDKKYDTGAAEEFDIALESSAYPLPGKYIFERIYKESSTTDKYDYFKRTLTIIIDNYNLISPLENVNALEEDLKTPAVDDQNRVISSLESVVGGDILLSLYSGDNNAAIEISFPKYNANGLNTGSFYSQESFSSDQEAFNSVSIRGNKLPVALHVPKYKYTIGSTSSIENNEKKYSVTKNDNLSYYGNSYYKFNEETKYYDVYIENNLVESFTTEQQAKDYIGNAEIFEYQIYLKIEAKLSDGVKYYYSDGTERDGYLVLYSGSKTGTINKADEVENFYQKGTYVVTIYQASNIGSTSKFYSCYKFGFEIIAVEPTFEVIGSDGYNLSNTNVANTYYTNSKSLKVQWEIPTNEYEAKIDEDNIVIKGYPTSASFTRSEIVDEGRSKYFTIDTERLLNADNSYIEITMQFEGHNRTYYSTITKRIYFDKAMPSQTLQNLMSLTEISTQNAFTLNYQLMYMRQYFDYNNNEVTLTNPRDLNSLSYSYSLNSGNFRYYSYNVDTSFFTNTLMSTLANASNNPYDTQSIFYKRIESLNNYNQVDKNSFIAGNYDDLALTTDNEISKLSCGYYEIIERDYAGNMVVYVVQLTNSTLENDPLYDTKALTYTNEIIDEDIIIDESEISSGFNIYSNSGFELLDLNYKSDAWGYFVLRRAGESDIRYMKSPWLDDTQVYRLIFSSNGVTFEQVSLKSLFDEVKSSSNKHRITLTNRISGESIPIYISIMDATLSTQKVEDPTHTSAILNVKIPTPAQVESTTTSYIFPKNIKISMLYKSIGGENEWRTIMIADQLIYGSWTPAEGFESATSFISFNTLPGATTLQIVVNLGANASQKVKYDITDNFGNITSVIQLANEVSYNEISGTHTVYELPESDGSTTYLSSNTINYSFNTLLYSVEIYNRDDINITTSISANVNTTTKIQTYTFSPSDNYFFDDYYKLIIKDFEDENDEGRVVHLRLYNKLPFRTTIANEVSQGGIIFNDKNQMPIDEKNIGSVPGTSVKFNGKDYYATADFITTFSQNVTVRFYNGQNLSYNGNYNYQTGYPFSVYLSSDSGNTWININSATSDVSGYTISGVGDYTILVKYDDENIFSELCRIYNISILDSSTSYYYITVDGLNVEKSNVKYTSLANNDYEINYIVSVDYSDKDNRLNISTNEELNVKLDLISTDTTGSNVTVEIYRYECNESAGDFTIIYIAETNNIISTFTYETSTGTTSSIKDVSSTIIVANRETEANFDRLKLTFSSFYGISSNKINVEVNKFFNGSYVKINSPIYSDGVDSYIFLNNPGTYRIRVYDSCTPANVQAFGNNRYIDIIFLSSVPFTVTNTIGEKSVVTEPIDKAVYNGQVTITPTNLASYYQASRMPVISVKRNGNDYYGFGANNNVYTFTEAGYYTISFTATSITGIPVRTEDYNFTIINKNESRYAFEFSEYDKYFIEKIEKDGIDVTDDLLTIGNFPTIVINGKTKLAGITLNYLDEKTGGGRYRITINPNNNEMVNTYGENFIFELWINMANPPVSVSIPEGEKTTKNITITLNVQNLYDAVGDCYIKVSDLTRYYTSDNISNYGVNDTITITGTGTFYIQIYTTSGHLLYSYKVIKNEPLNAFAIIAIVLGVVAVAAVIGITIALRKRQRVK